MAKFWLEPVPEVAESYGMATHKLRELIEVAFDYGEEIKRYWNEYFGC